MEDNKTALPPIMEIESYYEELDRSIQQVWMKARMVMGDHCETSVMRNKMITDMDLAEDEDRKQTLYRLLARMAHLDGEHIDKLQDIEGFGFDAQAAVKKIKEFYKKVSGWRDDQVDGLAAEIKSLQVQLEQAKARVREHAAHDETTRKQVWDLTGGKCFYCECALVRASEVVAGVTDRSAIFHVDHIVPKSAGGPDHLTNYVPSCQTCNISKSDKPVAVFMASRRQPKLTLVASS